MQDEFTRIVPDKVHVRVSELLGSKLETPCGGNMTCGKCKVRLRGALSPAAESERRFLSESELRDGWRMACMTYAEGEFEAVTDTVSDMRIQTEGIELTLKDNTPLAKGYGLAVDIGTTTIAVYLCDLESCRIISSRAVRNPQSVHGADVISRLGYAMESYPDGLANLQREAAESVNNAVAGFGVPYEDIKAAVVTGNTVMLHMAFGADPRGIANAPFTPSTLFGTSYRASETPFRLSKEGAVYVMPCFGPYVGGDIASGIAASGLDIGGGCELFIDIGTNGEIALSDSGSLKLCATAAGPAFEGAKIEKGMPGLTGAIRSFGREGYTVIGGGVPKGICGSGLIDTVAYMLDEGILDETGYIDDDFYLDRGHGIYLTAKDIREVQLAKAAVCAGIKTLLNTAERTAEDITRVVLAGGFGANLDPHSACRIGLIPPELESKITVGGNTAGMGAAAYLFSEDIRRRIDNIRKRAKLIELSANEFFINEYIEQMIFF